MASPMTHVQLSELQVVAAMSCAWPILLKGGGLIMR
jgi:hypothetical protein